MFHKLAAWAVLAAGVASGCQMSKATYPTNPQNTVRMSKGLGGFEFEAVNGADTTVVVENLNGEKSTTQPAGGGSVAFGLGKLQITSTPSVNERERATWMDKMLPMLLADNERERIRGDNAERIINAFREWLPYISNIIGRFNDVQMVKAQRGGIVADLTRLVEALQRVDPTIVTEAVKAAGVPAPVPPSP